MRDEKYYFRFIGVNKETITHLENYFKKGFFSINEIKGEKGQFVACCRLNQKMKKLITNYIKTYNIPPSMYGIYVTLTTSRDMDSLEFPKHVTELHHQIGGAIDISLLFYVENE